MKFSQKFIVVVLVFALIPLSIFWIISYSSSKNSITDLTLDRMEIITSNLSKNISEFYSNYSKSLDSIVKLDFVNTLVKSLENSFKGIDDPETMFKDAYINFNTEENKRDFQRLSTEIRAKLEEKYGDDYYNLEDYDLFHGKYNTVLNDFANVEKLEDIYLISRDGYVVYTLDKDEDFASNLNNKTGVISEIYNEMKQMTFESAQPVFRDFEYYDIKDKYIAFYGVPLTKYAVDGYLIITKDISELDNIVTKDKLKELTGKVYLMNDKNELMINLGNLKMFKDIINLDFNGTSGTEQYKSFDGTNVLGSYKTIDLDIGYPKKLVVE
ncbi:MAG TPA: hypothetical protein PLS66_11160, partial [Tepiditoga sp.]|nr:hypothetical protein [Tepiditoga sp.]